MNKLFKSKPGKLIAKGKIKKNLNKNNTKHPDLLGVYEDEDTGKYKRIALWLTQNKKNGKHFHFQITELSDDYSPSKADLF
jgi:hypothetical protein